MFDDESQKEEKPVDYTGLKITVALAPVFFFVTYLSNPEMGLTICIAVGMIVLAVKLRWKLRKNIWFWPIILFILALHVPFFLIIQWQHGNIPTIAFSLPMGIVDFLLIMGAIGLAEKFFLKGSPPDDVEE